MKSVFYASLALNFVLLSCAATQHERVTTWVITAAGLEHNSGATKELKPFAEGADFRCYSRDDDTIWRNRMALCCGMAGL
jgi:hypothetical protein